jgi:NADPH-dependent ferric siderophore reductase
LTPHLIRVVLGGKGFDSFTRNEFTDAYVKIVFVNHGVDVGALQQPLTLDSFTALPAEQQPTVRTYTVRSVDTERREQLPRAGARRRRAVGGRGGTRYTGLSDEP